MRTQDNLRLPRLLALLFVLGLATAPLSGCDWFVRSEENGNGENGNGGNGENGNGENGENGELTIYDVRDPARRADLGSLEDLLLEDLVVTAVRAYTHQGDPRHDVFVQHVDGGEYSAIMLFSVAMAPEPGDVLTVTGNYDNYFGMDQLTAVTFQVTGSAALPEPEVFSNPADIATGGSAHYSFQSVLVRVEDVSVTDPEFPGSDGNWRGDFKVDGDLVVGPLFRHEYASPVEGDHFQSITGVLNYSFDHSRLQPRFNEDMVFIDGTIPGPPEPSEVTIQDVRDPDRRAELGSLENLVLDDLVVTAVRSYTHQGHPRFDVFVQDPAGGPFSAIMLWSLTAAPEPGDVLTVTGDYSSYYGMDQLSRASVEVTGTMDIPEPKVFEDPSRIATGGDAHLSYQSVLARVEDVAVTDPEFPGTDGTWRGDFKVDGDLVVGPLFRHDYASPVEGDQFQSITGVLNYSFDHSRLQPRFNEDIVFIDGTIPGEGPGPEPTLVEISQVRDPEERAQLGSGPFTVEGIITARVPRHSQFDLWIQASENPGPWDGILVYNAPTEAVPGDLVRVTGDYDQWHGMDQLRNVSVEIIGSPGVPEPLVVEPGLIATESPEAFSYQAILLRVEVEGLQVVSAEVPGDDESRAGDFVVNDGLVIGTELNDYEAVEGQGFQSITGVLRHTYSHHRLEPRSDEDIVLSY